MSFSGTSDNQQDKIYINVGGKRHESYLSTLRNIPDTRLAWMAETIMNKQEESTRKELFFDRHPDLFALILNYYRTGKLHAPRDVCGPLFEDELNFWGIEEKEMEACCWPTYVQHREAEKNLKDFVGPEFEEEDSDDDFKELENGLGSDANSLSLWQKYQPPIWAVLDDAFSSSRAKVFAWVSLLMILISVLLMCAASLPSIRENESRREAFKKVEYFFCAWFTLEFLMRLILCPSKVAFCKEMMTWIDLISLMPYYSKIIFNTNKVDFLRAIRLIRLFRAFRFFKFTSGLQIIVQSLKASVRELLLLVIILLIPVVLFSSFVYEMEKEMQPVKFNSIPHTFWWAVITMTTVGYGDMSPKSVFGQIIGSVCAICGVLIIGLPVSVIGNNFSTYYEHAQARLSLPKKKRRLIMGDANRLAILQGQSNSSGDRDRKSMSVDLHTNDSNGEEEMSRNYRRYHRRSRNTIFARGDVYIGQVKPKHSDLSPPMERNAEENDQANGDLNHMERGELSSDDNADCKNPTFTLTNNSYNSDEIVGKHQGNSLKNGLENGKRRNKRADPSRVSDVTKSKSLAELKNIDSSNPLPSSTSPRPSSTRSFRSRVSPSPGENENNIGHQAQNSSARGNSSLTLPPLTLTVSKRMELMNSKGDVYQNGSEQATSQNTPAHKSDDNIYIEEKQKRTRMHQNGNVSYG